MLEKQLQDRGVDLAGVHQGRHAPGVLAGLQGGAPVKKFPDNGLSTPESERLVGDHHGRHERGNAGLGGSSGADVRAASGFEEHFHDTGVSFPRGGHQGRCPIPVYSVARSAQFEQTSGQTHAAVMGGVDQGGGASGLSSRGVRPTEELSGHVRMVPEQGAGEGRAPDPVPSVRAGSMLQKQLDGLFVSPKRSVE